MKDRISHQPGRQQRLGRIFADSPSYFLTLCSYKRCKVLNTAKTNQRIRDFAAESFERYGVFVNAYVLMPDHAHIIITLDRSSETTIGDWVKAFKATVARRDFMWQIGFFDHLLRSYESKSEKWEYIRMNPVRAGLVSDPEQWPYVQQFNPIGGL